MNTEHFKEAEFACRCCGETKPNMELMLALEDVRAKFGLPVAVNSGYRCPEHNANVGGSPRSQHMLGTAADIYIKGIAPSAVYKYLDKKYPNSCGVGSYSTFTHFDIRPSKARW